MNDCLLDGLKAMYALYDQFSAELAVACRKGCDLCCTSNVTLTSLEGRAILAHWKTIGQAPPLGLLEEAAQHPRFQPTMTINQMAARCAQGWEIPEEAADPDAGPCPLLRHGVCTVYAARPLGCRLMVSQWHCAQSGAADMPDIVLAASNLFLQFVEALDRAGRSGNLTDLLLWLCTTAQPGAGASNPHPPLPARLTLNHPISVIMMPPQYHGRLAPMRQALHRILNRHTPAAEESCR